MVLMPAVANFPTQIAERAFVKQAGKSDSPGGNTGGSRRCQAGTYSVAPGFYKTHEGIYKPRRFALQTPRTFTFKEFHRHRSDSTPLILPRFQILAERCNEPLFVYIECRR